MAGLPFCCLPRVSQPPTGPAWPWPLSLSLGSVWPQGVPRPQAQHLALCSCHPPVLQGQMSSEQRHRSQPSLTLPSQEKQGARAQALTGAVPRGTLCHSVPFPAPGGELCD